MEYISRSWTDPKPKFKMEKVIKRDGRIEEVDFNKILERIKSLCHGLNTKHVNAVKVAKMVIQGVYDMVPTSELDMLAVKVAGGLNVEHPDYGLLAGRISASNLQKQCPKTFSECVEKLYNYEQGSLVSEEFYQYVIKHADSLNAMVVHEKDLTYNVFSMETLKRSYLLRCGDKIMETPQYMNLRIATFLNMHRTTMEVRDTYNALSDKKYTHASPTMFNAGAPRAQMASCFLLKLHEDSIQGIYKSLSDCAQISKYAGGIGLSIHELRSSGSYIAGNNGKADGIVPALRVFNETALYVNQGGRRKGSFAIYLEPHHGDIMDFLQLRLPGGAEERRTRDLFTAMWTSDLFFERVKAGEKWSLFDPNTAPGLNEVYGDQYVKLYEKYESEGRAIQVLPAQKVWDAIVTSVTETGTPYLLNKDQCNRMSNQRGNGVIQSSNLCAEIVQYSSKNESAVCNLASINLSAFVNDDKSIDYDGLANTASLAVRNLNTVIDKSFYPTEETKRSNQRHRPLGLGVSGLADVFFKVGIPFDSQEARDINRNMFEAMYYGAVRESALLAAKDGSYPSYKTSPASLGLLQFDMWRSPTHNPGVTEKLRKELDSTLGWEDRWQELCHMIKNCGMRNSLLTAVMPTASSASIIGTTECVEPVTSNIYSRAVLSGEFTLVNKYLVDELDKLNLWDKSMSQKIIANDGSVQGIDEIPKELQDRFKTVWEISQKAVIDMSFHRSQFVDQSQSLNLFMTGVTKRKYSSMLFYAWARRLKTMQYYLRSQSATQAVKFTVKKQEEECLSCQA